MNPGQLIATWRRVQLTERSAAQQHFLDHLLALNIERSAAKRAEK